MIVTRHISIVCKGEEELARAVDAAKKLVHASLSGIPPRIRLQHGEMFISGEFDPAALELFYKELQK